MSDLLVVTWMLDRHVNGVLEIERESFEFPWNESQVREQRQKFNTLGMVCVSGSHADSSVVGYVFYETHASNRSHILSLAVAPGYRRRGVGSLLMKRVVENAQDRGRRTNYEYPPRIAADVRETNLDAQLFFKSHGFRCIAILRDFYTDTTESAYTMQLRLQREGMEDAKSAAADVDPVYDRDRR